MLYGSIKLACMQAKMNALKIAKQNREEYLAMHKDIPEWLYDQLPNNGRNHTKQPKRSLRKRRK